MFVRLLLAVLLLAGFSGCASMRKTSHADEMNSRVTELEQQLDSKDTEISQLKGDIQELSEQVRMKQALTARGDFSGDSSSISGDGLVRVNASPDKIQLALRGAGFYSGPVDGKLGAKTRKAITEFQRAHSLKADGVIGKKTWAELKTYLD